MIFLMLLSILFTAHAESNTTDTNNSSFSASQINATGILKIVTVPVDVSIYIDDQFMGGGLYYNTSFPVGVYRISFSTMDGYEGPKFQIATVSAGNQTTIVAESTRVLIGDPPQVTVTKEVSASYIAIDETVDVILKIKNTANTKVFVMSFNESIPDCAVLVKGEVSWSGDLDSGESKILDYTIRPAKVGLCIFPPSSMVLSDSTNMFAKYSDEVKVFISPKPINEPHLVVEKNADKSTALVGDGAVITLKVKNNGPAKAFNVTLVDDIPFCAVITQGKSHWNGDMEPDEEKTITYIMSLRTSGLCPLDAAKASYSDANNNHYVKYSEQLNIYVKEKSMSESLGQVAKPIVIIGIAIASLLIILIVYMSRRNKLCKEKEGK